MDDDGSESSSLQASIKGLIRTTCSYRWYGTIPYPRAPQMDRQHTRHHPLKRHLIRLRHTRCPHWLRCTAQRCTGDQPMEVAARIRKQPVQR